MTLGFKPHRRVSIRYVRLQDCPTGEVFRFNETFCIKLDRFMFRCIGGKMQLGNHRILIGGENKFVGLMDSPVNLIKK